MLELIRFGLANGFVSKQIGEQGIFVSRWEFPPLKNKQPSGCLADVNCRAVTALMSQP